MIVAQGSPIGQRLEQHPLERKPHVVLRRLTRVERLEIGIVDPRELIDEGVVGVAKAGQPPARVSLQVP